jgi:hypothetical protein
MKIIPYDIKKYKVLNTFYIFKPLKNDKYLDLMYEDAQKIHKDNKKYNIQKHYYNDGKYHIYLEDVVKINNKNKYKNMVAFNVIHKLKKNFIKTSNYLYAIIYLILNCKKKISKKKMEDLMKKDIKILLLRYDKNSGKRLHLDNVWRTNGGMIITINIGPDYIYYDLVPITKKIEKNSYRVLVKKGDIFVLDGLSRYLYAHSVPHNCEFDKFKFSWVILFNKIEYLIDKKIYNEYLNTEIISSYLKNITICNK